MKLNAWQALGHRRYQAFDPTAAPLHFLDAVRYALAACVASQDLEHFWATFNLEWPDCKTRSNVSLRQVPPLQCLVAASGPGTPAEWGRPSPWKRCAAARRKRTVKTPRYKSITGASQSSKPLTWPPCEKWTCVCRFSSLLSILRIGRTMSRSPAKGPPPPKEEGLVRCRHGTLGISQGPCCSFNSAWSKLYFNQKPGDPTPEALVAVRRFPLNLDNGRRSATPRRRCGVQQKLSLWS